MYILDNWQMECQIEDNLKPDCALPQIVEIAIQDWMQYEKSAL